VTTTPLQSLAEYGQCVWIVAAPRELISGRRLERLMREHGITGVISGELVVRDTQQLCDLLLPTWHGTGGRDGYVSLDGGLRTVERAEQLQGLVGRPNLLVALPPTEMIEDVIAAGVSVNVTPIFSPERHREVVEAYLRGLERLLDRGGDPAAVTSVASIVVSAVDVEVDRRLEQVGGGAVALRGRLAIANARLAYQQYLEAFCGTRWRALESLGARRQRCLWASASSSPGAYSEVFYVEELIGADTITAVSPATVEAFEDCGIVADRLGRRIDEARMVVDDVRTAGIDLEDVWRTLEQPQRSPQ
jgi:transaldolase